MARRTPSSCGTPTGILGKSLRAQNVCNPSAVARAVGVGVAVALCWGTRTDARVGRRDRSLRVCSAACAALRLALQLLKR